MNNHVDRYLRRLCAFFVMIAMIGTELMGLASAKGRDNKTRDGKDEQKVMEEEVLISSEVETLRGEFEKHYLLSDGSFMAMTYAEAVHYKDSTGKWQEVDNTLSQKKGEPDRIENSYEAFKVSFANTGSKGDIVSLSGKNKTLSWSLRMSKKSETFQPKKNGRSYKAIISNQGENKSSEDRIVGKKVSEKDLFTTKKMMGKVRYESVDETTPELSVDYTVYHNKIEEDIYINAPTDKETIDFSFHSNGLSVIVKDDRSVEFLNEKGKTEYRIGIPYMEDAKNEVLNDIEVSVRQDGDSWIVSYRPNAEWFHSAERVYPILLDPSITTGEYQSNITDTYVLQGNTANHSSEQKLYVGVRSGKINRIYLRINNLPEIDSNMPIVSATLQLTNTIGSSTGKLVQLYRLGTTWNPATITYANQPRISTGNQVASCSFKPTYSFNLTEDITNLYAGSYANNGYVLKYADESSNKPDYNAVYSSEYTTVSYRPVLTVTYGYALPSVLSNGGVYSFQNVGSKAFLTVHGGSDSNGTNVYQQKVSTSSRSLRHMFKLEYVSATGGYYLRALCSSDGTNRVLDIAKSNGYVVNGCNVQIYNPTDALAQHWFIIGVGRNEFKIVPRTNMSLALKAYGTSNGTSGGKTATSAGNVFVANYSSSDSYQRWYVVDESGNSSGGESYVVGTGTYYLNNKSYGKFIDDNGGTLRTVSGLTATLGNRIRWKISSIGAGRYTIQSVSEPAKYLYASGASIYLGTMSGGANVPNNYTWVITSASGGDMLIKNYGTGKYLCFNGSALTLDTTLGATGSDVYKNHVWRIASTANYGALAPSGSRRELTADTKFDLTIVDVGETKRINYRKNPTNALWADWSDYDIQQISRVTEAADLSTPIINFNKSTGEITGVRPGKATYKATHKVTNREFTFEVIVDHYTYTLMDFFHFSAEEAVYIRRVYDRVDNYISSNGSEEERLWTVSRLLSSFTYTGIKWKETASEVVAGCDDKKLKEYFVGNLFFSEQEYGKIKNAIKTQHKTAETEGWPDFEHMQASLAARLAYALSIDGLYGIMQSDLEISYLAGWLGDAVIAENGNEISFKGDDYYADLDAENIFQGVGTAGEAVKSPLTYYHWISDGGNRASLFLTYCTYKNVESRIYNYLGDIESIKENAHDTYSFLRCLQDKRTSMVDY